MSVISHDEDMEVDLLETDVRVAVGLFDENHMFWTHERGWFKASQKHHKAVIEDRVTEQSRT